MSTFALPTPLILLLIPFSRADCVGRWVQREARPISLRQLTFFGRTLTENRLISSANYVRTELPTRSHVLLIVVPRTQLKPYETQDCPPSS